jgi:hypothetical protein
MRRRSWSTTAGSASGAPTWTTVRSRSTKFQDRGIATQLVKVFKEDLKFARAVDHDNVRRGLNGIFYLTLLPLRDQL